VSVCVPMCECAHVCVCVCVPVCVCVWCAAQPTVDLSSEPSFRMVHCTVVSLLTISLDLKKHFRIPVVPFSTTTTAGAWMSTADMGRVPGGGGRQNQTNKKPFKTNHHGGFASLLAS